MKNEAAGMKTFLNRLVNTAAFIKRRISYRSHQEFSPKLVRSEVTPEGMLWLSFADKDLVQDISIPIPVEDGCGNKIIIKGHVERAVGTWIVDDEEYSYWGLMSWLFTERVEEFLPTTSKRIYLERLLRSFEYEAAPMVFRNFQKVIDDLVNGLPLAGTPIQNWAMCNRVQIIDPVFDTLSPKEALQYQTDLNKEKFPWTSLGLSDSGMCNNNILKVDVRKTVPYGLSHHNPGRNLYQTLGMRGDETPKVMSITESRLAERGIVRKGWRWMTAFINLPDNFEDQIIVNERLRDLFLTNKKTYTSFGTVLVQPGDGLDFLYPMAVEDDGSVIKFDLEADDAYVEDVEDVEINFNGTKQEVKQITVRYKRYFKDGFKITNRHGNKGIIFMADTGYIEDPQRGKVPVDVIVSAKSVQKRKNFGQILEALTSLIYGKDEQVVVKDDYVAHTDKVKDKLVERGYSADGTVKAINQWGEFKAVAGWVHWGCIKTPEDQIWNFRDTRLENNKDVRTAGNKVSHIETKGLITTFGPNNPIVKEIMSHRQGVGHVFDTLEILEELRGKEKDVPVVDYSSVMPIVQTEEFFHDLVEFTGTISDETLFPLGFYIKIPDDYKYVIRKLPKGKYKEDFLPDSEITNRKECVILDKILIMPAEYRKPWKHMSGKYGLSDTAALINTIVTSIHKYKSEEGEASKIGRAIYLYFHGLSKSMSSKTGHISNYCLSVRYPWTVKGTAAVSSSLAPNEVEIHERMARDLNVKDGDYVVVERFPCLGFMSIRTQKVRVTNDERFKYVIRVSGNSLNSLALDFDGDVIYLMSFHSPESKEALKNEFENPLPSRSAAYKAASDKKVPAFKELALDDYKIEIFPKLDADTNAKIVNGLTGIKRGTGTVIALCYSLLRILERNVGYKDADMAVAMELLLDKVANSVFSKKHAGRSLEDECREAICTADVDKMIDLGFGKDASVLLSGVIKKLSKECGFNPNSLPSYFRKCEEEGKSSIINIIIRRFHRLWYTSRSNQHPITMLENLETAPQDLTGYLFKDARELHYNGNTGERDV